jgi:hypothetical protein
MKPLLALMGVLKIDEQRWNHHCSSIFSTPIKANKGFIIVHVFSTPIKVNKGFIIVHLSLGTKDRWTMMKPLLALMGVLKIDEQW